MLKIANFDLGFADECYSLNPKKYGGGSVLGRHCKQLDNFHLFAPAKSFENLNNLDRKENCFILSDKICHALKNGYPIDLVFPDINKYDLILHGHTNFSFNRTNRLEIPVIHWSGFGGDAGHSFNNYILLYRKCFNACYGEKAKYVTIGKDVPKEFKEFNERDGIFQATQHCNDFGSIDIAKECIKHGIKGIFAGPIRDYPLLDYIDNKNTFYVGILSEEDKLNYTKKAKLYTLPLKWEVAFNQSAIEAGGLGTPILATKRGWFNEYIKDGINGFFYDQTNFLECYRKSDRIDQRLCWESAREFSIENMVNSFYQAFNEIKNEWIYK